jgi:hypothetical protein
MMTVKASNEKQGVRTGTIKTFGRYGLGIGRHISESI